MIHHPGDALSALLDGELDAVEASEVVAHVADCPDCTAELDGIRDARLRLRDLPAVEPPPAFAAFLLDPAVVVSLDERRRSRRRTVAANVGAAAAAAVAAVALLGGSATGAAAVAPEPRGAVERHDETVTAVSAALGGSSSAGVTATTAPPMDDLPAPYVAPDELAGYRMVQAYEVPAGVHVLYEKGEHRLSLFEQRGDLGDLPERGTKMGDVWRWDDPRADGRVLVVERGEIVITLVGEESAAAVLAAARAVPGGADEGEPLGRRLARACGKALEGLSPAG